MQQQSEAEEQLDLLSMIKTSDFNTGEGFIEEVKKFVAHFTEDHAPAQADDPGHRSMISLELTPGQQPDQLDVTLPNTTPDFSLLLPSIALPDSSFPASSTSPLTSTLETDVRSALSNNQEIQEQFQEISESEWMSVPSTDSNLNRPPLPEMTQVTPQDTSPMYGSWHMTTQSTASSSKSSPEDTLALLDPSLQPVLPHPTQTPHAKIEEQPEAVCRFRYKSDRRSSASIRGQHWTSEMNTYPRIKIYYHPGPFLIIASCVTVEAPHRVHPHQLFGVDGANGVRFMCGMAVIETTNNEFSLRKIGIMRMLLKDNTAKESIRERLGARLPQLRADQVIYPLQNGAPYAVNNLRAVRLAFQVFVREYEGWQELQILVSDPIHNETSLPRDIISSHPILLEEVHGTVAPVAGNTRSVMVIFFAKNQKFKMNLQELKVIFYDKSEWEMEANIASKRTGVLVVHVPAYGGSQPPIEDRIPVWFVVRSKAGNVSAANAFHYTVDRVSALVRSDTSSSESETESSAKRVCQETSNIEGVETNLDADSEEDSSDEEDDFTNRFGSMKL